MQRLGLKLINGCQISGRNAFLNIAEQPLRAHQASLGNFNIQVRCNGIPVDLPNLLRQFQFLKGCGQAGHFKLCIGQVLRSFAFAPQPNRCNYTQLYFPQALVVKVSVRPVLALEAKRFRGQAVGSLSGISC